MSDSTQKDRRESPSPRRSQIAKMRLGKYNALPQIAGEEVVIPSPNNRRTVDEPDYPQRNTPTSSHFTHLYLIHPSSRVNQTRRDELLSASRVLLRSGGRMCSNLY